MARTEKAIRSEKVSSMFGLDLDWWNSAMLVSLGFAALAAFAVVVSTAVVIKLQKAAEVETKQEFDRYKFESDERIAAANSVGEAAKADAAKAHADIAKANAEIILAKERTAEAERKTAELEKQGIELREKVANRRISPEQYAALVAVLSTNPSTIDFVTMGDPESGLYAADFLKTFTAAGWQIGAKEFPLGEIWTGLLLYETDSPSIKIVISALAAAKIPYSRANAPKRERATLLIGGRPPFF
jgi:hypothetical protein